MIKSAKEFIKLRFSSNPDEYSRAANEEADVDTWMELINNHEDMREWVAHNKKIPLEIIRILAKDCNSTVRYHIATKRKIPVDVMELLVNDEDESIRMAIARNKSTPKEILKLLVNDDWKEIVKVTKKRLLGET